RTYEEIMDIYKYKLAILNITLCKNCFHPIKVKEDEYCDSC
ncbi:2272_t:CDS:1, partial [Gigaspora margarita]